MTVLNRLTRPKRGQGRLAPALVRDAIPEGLVRVPPSGSGIGAGGYVSPLTEQSRETTIVTVTDASDASFSIDFEVATKLTLTDAAGTELVINLTP